MTIDQKIEKKGYSVKAIIGYKNGEQVVTGYAAMQNGKEQATAKSKTALLNKL